MTPLRACCVLLASLYPVLFCSEWLAAQENTVITGAYALLLGDDSVKNFKSDEITPIVPREDAFKPLGKKRFIPFSRQIEYVQVGSSYKSNYGNNYFVIDPLQYNYDPANPGTPITNPGDDDVMAQGTSAFFTEAYKKTAAIAMLDDDVQDETAVVCWTNNGPGTLVLINPAGEPEATTFDVTPVPLDLTIDNQQDLAYDYDITSGDVDGDGYDELIVSGSLQGDTAQDRLGKVWVIDVDQTGSVVLFSKIFDGPTVNETTSSPLGVDQLKVTAGNVDDDQAYEFAVAFAAISQHAVDEAGSIHYIIFDDALQNFSVLHQDTALKDTLYKNNAGGEPEPLVTEAAIDPLTRPFEEYFIPQGTFLNYFNITMGDMDKDGQDEIAIALRSHEIEQIINSYPYGQWYLDESIFVEVIGWENAAFSPLKSSENRVNRQVLPITFQDRYTYVDYLRFFDALDIDGDKADELFIGWHILDDINTNNPHPLSVLTDPTNPNSNITIRPWGYRVEYNGEIGPDTATKITHISFGDVNGDLREDITILFESGLIQTIGFQVDGDNRYWRGGYTAQEHHWFITPYNPALDTRGDLLDNNSYISNAILASANVDNDSTIVEYSADDPDTTPGEQGESHTTYYSRNQIIAILASPPAIDNINTKGTSTSFGLSSTQSVGVGATASVRAGALVGMTLELQAGFIVSTTVASVEAELSAQIEMTASVDTSVEVTKAISYTTGDKEDQVIFSTTPYDRYHYTLASHPDSMLAGKELTIDVPQSPKVLSVTKEEYNKNNGNQMDIGKEIIQHTPGDITSYPSRSQKDAILAQTELPGPSTIPLVDDGLWLLLSQTTSLCEYSAETVQQGTGSNTLELALDKKNIYGAGIKGSMDWMAKACAVGVCGGLTAGFSIGTSNKYSLTQGIRFSANVSAIPGNWEDKQYQFGIFAYKQRLKDNTFNTIHDFVVVNYWVE